MDLAEYKKQLEQLPYGKRLHTGLAITGHTLTKSTPDGPQGEPATRPSAASLSAPTAILIFLLQPLKLRRIIA
jgi:hypothetical protein